MAEEVKLSKKALSLKPGIYEHYKGNKYRVEGVALHSETLEEMVAYRALYGKGLLWVRPLDMFLEEVNVDGKVKPRFKLIEESKI
jgi:hypothetical protein